MKNILKIIFVILGILLVIIAWQIYKNPDNETLNENVSSGNENSGQEIVEINIQNFAFNPKKITIKKGTTIVWTNFDSVGHTATSDDGLFNSDILSKGETWSYTFNEKGTYGYYCIPHPNMVGEIVVE